VHEPCTGVIGLEGENKVTPSGEVGGVPADWIVSLETRNIAIPNCVFLLVEDVKVVAVKMNGMR
jgi:hypothetical protein